MAVKTFSVGETLTASDTNTYLANSGLVVVTPSGVTNGTISGAKVTVGSAVTSVTVSGVFSATYDNYRIMIVGGTQSSIGDNLTLQLSGSTGSTYSTAGSYVSYNTATVNAYAPAATTSFLAGFAGTNNSFVLLDLFAPNLAKRTGMVAMSAAKYNYSFTGEDTSTAQSTGFTLSVTSGTITGQTIMVYGYRLG